jgi:hypothetical protein
VHGGHSRPQVVGSISIGLGVLALLAYPAGSYALLRWKYLYESLHPGVIIDPAFPGWFLVVGIVLIVLGFYQLAKREPSTA